MMDGAMDADRLVQQALEYMNSGDFDRAKILLKKAATAAPLRADIRNLLVQVMAQQPAAAGKKAARDKAAPAEAPAEAPAAAQGSRFWLWMIVGSFCLLLALGGLGVAGYFLIGRNFLRDVDLGEDRRGTTGIEDVDVSKPAGRKDDPNAEKREHWRKQAAEAAEQGNYTDAIQIIGTLLQTGPPDPKVYEKELARCHFELGRQKYKNDAYSEAIDNFDRAVRLDAGNGDYFFWLGLTHFRKGLRDTGSRQQQEWRAAEEALKQAVRLDPENLLVYDTLAKTCIRLGKQIEGVQYYQEIIKRAPASPEADQARRDLRDMGMELR